MRLMEWLARRPRLGDFLALGAGAVLPLAFAPVEWRVLSILSPALLFLLWLGATPRRAFWRGYLFGLGQFGVGVSWVYNSIHLFGNAVAPLAGLFTALFVAFLALYPAVTGGLLARFGRRFRLSMPAMLAVLPFGWVLYEWVRGWLFTGFPWLLLGHPQVDTWLGGYVPTLGTYGASLAVALVATALAGLVVLAGRARWLALGSAAILVMGGMLLSSVQWTRPAGDVLTVSIVQPSIAQEDKWRREQFQPTLDVYEKLTRAHFGRDLIVWPESAIPATFGQVAEDYLLPLAADARAHGTALVTGIFVRDPTDGTYYNSLVALDRGIDVYDKRHLVPFGEYTPLRGLLGWIDRYVVIPMSDLGRGTGRPLLSVNGYPVGASICYEDAFGEEVIEALPEAAYLINVSNDAWFGDSLAPWQHLELARVRSLETGRWMVRATNTGVSAVIDARGRIAAISPQFELHVLNAEIQPYVGVTPYARWGNWPVAGMAILVFVLLAGMRWRR
ncbi:MAG TPA: apolipoprotein N-acyltransferase [Thioalkalivibrio sp.]|nr:apolipoprotein N-acyltransferase [Thioalkalivibrio sp.]